MIDIEKRTKVTDRSTLERAFKFQLRAAKITGYQEEYLFYPGRRWRADFAWPKEYLLLEIEGGAFVGGRHCRGAGFTKDIEKYLAAAEMGFNVIRIDSFQIRNGRALQVIEKILIEKR